MIVDFRRKKTPLDPLVIHGQPINRVDYIKFLGTVISRDLSWDNNCTVLLKKAHQRLFFLRQLKKFGLRREILVQFYRSTIESILTFSLCVWYGSATKKLRGRMQRVVRTASKIIGSDMPSLDTIFFKRTLARSKKITADPSHPAHHLFQLLPSGKRHRVIRTKTTRFQNSFYPLAVKVL
eukprot:TRINITY_DN26857_c0_g1_i3.p1 TRINITY_DN26857_c0_g1~~TRINITY_DN26857_c0_g1_i3.p1  ORF type:complete len:180 (-),score=24.86 TRINITY_DN26857_c0_g1_i3:115-654(-)